MKIVLIAASPSLVSALEIPEGVEIEIRSDPCFRHDISYQQGAKVILTAANTKAAKNAAAALVIPVFDPAQVPTVEAAQKLHQQHRDLFNKSLELMNRGLQTEAAHTKIARAYDKWACDLARHWLASPEMAWRVLDNDLTFQGIEGNYEVDDSLKKNPELKGKVMADSESGQGFWYVSTALLDKTLAHLKPLVEKGKVSVHKWDGKFPPSFIWK